MKKILVTGANGQLGKCIKDISQDYPNVQFVFAGKEYLDISNLASIRAFFDKTQFDHCINTAAYTNVEKAESDAENAFKVNAEGVKFLAAECEALGITLWHISTDYVFDGTKESPYVENDSVNPINVYGASKLKGENYIREIAKKYFIIRTSWLYSQYGHNFYKSILKFAAERDELTITTEQTGTPTNANDLAKAILELIASNEAEYGCYHFSNAGSATWFDFAEAIVRLKGDDDRVNVVKTEYYPTFAKRPKYSVLDTTKIAHKLNFSIPEWRESLKQLVKL